MTRLHSTVSIDARSASYPGESIRLMAITKVDSGKVLIKKQAEWREPASITENRLLVTDTPSVFEHWDIAFNEANDIKAVIASYNAAMRAGLVHIEDDLMRYQPQNIMQVRKMDERGQVMEFDSSSINNGHMAVMLAVWASQKAHGGYVMLEVPRARERADDVDTSDDSMLPFSM